MFINERWCSLAGTVNWKPTLFCEAWLPTIWMSIVVLAQSLVEPSLMSSQVSRDLSVVGEHPVVLPIRIEPHVLLLPTRVHVLLPVILPIRMEPHMVMVPGASHHCSTS